MKDPEVPQPRLSRGKLRRWSPAHCSRLAGKRRERALLPAETHTRESSVHTLCGQCTASEPHRRRTRCSSSRRADRAKLTATTLRASRARSSGGPRTVRLRPWSCRTRVLVHDGAGSPDARYASRHQGLLVPPVLGRGTRIGGVYRGPVRDPGGSGTRHMLHGRATRPRSAGRASAPTCRSRRRPSRAIALDRRLFASTVRDELAIGGHTYLAAAAQILLAVHSSLRWVRSDDRCDALHAAPGADCGGSVTRRAIAQLRSVHPNGRRLRPRPGPIGGRYRRRLWQTT